MTAKKRLGRLCACLGMGVGALALPVDAAQLTVTLSGLSSDQGRVYCGLYDGPQGWRDEAAASHTVVAPIHQNRAVCVFESLAPGRYALAAFHAPHGETKVSYGLFGQPKQSVGFSNNPSILFGPPDFEEAVLRLSGDQAITVEMRH